MGRHKNESGTFIPVGLKIRHEIITRIFRNPMVSVKIPSARELAERFHLSPSTVTLELQKLIKDGYLIGKRGSGTYTNPEKINFAPQSVGRNIVGILVGDGRWFCYDAMDWAVLSACGAALSPEIARPRFVTLLAETPETVYEELINQNLAGLLWLHPDKPFLKIIPDLIRNGLPTVSLATYGQNLPGIDYSFFHSGEKIAQKIIEEKRKKIFFGPVAGDCCEERLKGMLRFFAVHPENKADLVILQQHTAFSGDLEKHLREGDVPDAIYTHGEYIFTTLDLLQKYHVDIRQRCRLFAEGDHLVKCSRFHGYAIHYQTREIGEKAFEILQELWENPNAKPPVSHAQFDLMLKE